MCVHRIAEIPFPIATEPVKWVGYSRVRERVMVLAAKKDYYEVLGVDRNADQAAIKKAYRKLAKKYHPDTNDGNGQAEQRFKEITEAYTTLSDPEKKKLYDQFGHRAFDGTGNPYEGTSGSGFYGNPFGRQGDGGYYSDFPGAGKNGGGYRTYHFEGSNMDDMFRDIFGGSYGNRKNNDTGKQGFSGFGSHGGFGQGGFWDEGFRQGNYSDRGEDLNAEVTISFEDAAFGCDRMIRLQSTDGSGKIQSLQVHIPAGIDNGKSIRLRGKGMMGVGGGEPGDLLLKVTIKEKPGFERKGTDVYSTVNIPFTTAVFGGEVQVQTIDGFVLCKIREGTQSGTRIRLRGKGIISMKDPDVRGDQYVTVQIQVPQNLSPEAKQKLREYDVVSKK